MVLWMQELLKSAIPSQRTTGSFARQTLGNLQRFQASHGIPTTGETGPLTWRALLRLPVYRVRWAADAGAARDHRTLLSRAPESASLPALAYEISKPTGRDGGGSGQP